MLQSKEDKIKLATCFNEQANIVILSLGFALILFAYLMLSKTKRK